LPLRFQSAALAVLTAAVATSLCWIAFGTFEIRERRAKLTSIAALVAHHVAVPMAAHDADAAERILSHLDSHPAIKAAGIYTREHLLLARYTASAGTVHPLPLHFDPYGVDAATKRKLDLGSIAIGPVEANGSQIGFVYLEQENSLPIFAFTSFHAIALASFLAIGIAAFAFSRRLQELMFGRTIHAMQQLARAHADNWETIHAGSGHDFIRSLTASDDGGLAEVAKSFNELTRKLYFREQDLRQQNTRLESEVKSRTAELLDAKQRAENSSRAKSEFLANMSHEIRTPINGVMGTLELLQLAEPTQEQRELLRLAQDSASSLLSVINDILDFSKIEAGKLDLESTDFDLAETVAEATRAVALRAHQKKLELAYSVAPDVPQFVRGDAVRLKQVLLNLTGNAVKFTDGGEVVVRVELSGREADSVHLTFSVSDTGIGIDPQLHQSIFEAFSQADASTTRKFGGTGLGLAICSRLIRQMGGRIWVESELGKGSTFRFTAILREAQTRPTPAASLTSLEGVRVLIVDDNLVNRQILRRTMIHWGMQPETASSGPEALQLLAESAAQAMPFQLLLLDFHMPDMDGLQLTRQICRLQTPAPTIVMLTSDDYNASVQACKAAGVSTYLIKPVKQSELMTALLKLVALQPAASALQSASALDTPARVLNVLVAEDNVVNQRVAQGLLKTLGHRVTVVSDGSEALASIEEQPFDLVFMDVQMPKMDGITATEHIRRGEVERQRHVPIIAMTAHALSGDRERLLDCGMDDYVSKPISLEMLRRAIERAVSRPARFDESMKENLVPHNT